MFRPLDEIIRISSGLCKLGKCVYLERLLREICEAKITFFTQHCSIRRVQCGVANARILPTIACLVGTYVQLPEVVLHNVCPSAGNIALDVRSVRIMTFSFIIELPSN